MLNECGGDPIAALEKVGGEEALHLTSRGYITQVGSSGLRVGPPDQQRNDLLETESLDTGDSSVAPEVVEAEVVPWSLSGFASLAVVLLFVFAVFSYWRIANERDGAITEREAARQARRVAEQRLESAVLQQRSDRDALLFAEDQQRILQRQRNVAEHQKDIALEAVKKSLLDMRGRLDSTTDANRVLRELLKENFAMLDHILELEPDSIDLQMEKSANKALMGS